MVELADIFRLHGPQYRAMFGDRMRPSHLRARPDIEPCRTAGLGGQVYHCDHGQAYHYRYHSCQNRHCPQCQNDQAQLWLEHQQSLWLPVTHFMVTFTLPDQFRAVARSHQKTIYNILFRASSEALQQLALDPRFIGGRIGMVGVLHTWTRDLLDHPHVHYIVTGGGLSTDGQWLPSRPDFLVPVKPLSVMFRAKVRDHLKKTDLFSVVPERVWTQDWVVHCQPVGTGEHAFRYLAPYIFRLAISNNRILKLEDGQVTFQSKDSATDQIKTCTVTAEEFIRRFLQHVLPDRFIKVRYYGRLSPSHRDWLTRARECLRACLKRLLQAMSFRSWSLTFNLPNATTHFQAMSFRSWSLTFNLAKAGSQAPRAQARGLRKSQGVVVVGHQSSTTRSSAWPDHFSDTLSAPV